MNANDSASSLRILTDASPARSDATKLRKLCSLVRFHGEELMRGTTKLSLSIDVLHVILRLVRGDASEITNDGSDPLLFEAACLQDVLKGVLKLKVCKPPNPTSANVVDLSAFEQLTSLEIVGLPLDAISGLNGLTRRLSSITLEKCKFRSGIHDFFVASAVISDASKREADDDDGVEEAVEWPELREANIVRNELSSLDSSLTLAPRLKILDASYNNLTDDGVDSLSRFGQLTRVNLSFNKLKSVPNFGPGSGVFLHTLLLRNNSLETLNGLEGLVSLKVLDVAFNFLAWAGAMESLKSLSNLTALHLEGNPLFYSKSYRSTVAKCLHPSVMSRKFMLDGSLLTPIEKDAIRDAALDRINLVPQPLASFDLNLSRGTPDPETSSFGGASQASSQPRAKSRRIREALITSTDDYEGSRPFAVGSVRSVGSVSSRRSRKAMVSSASSGNLHVVRAIVEKNPSNSNSRPSSGQKTPLSSTPIQVDPGLTREKLRALRNQYGSDNWLGALAASQATAILGGPAEPSPIKTDDPEAKHETVIRPSLGCQRSLIYDEDGVEQVGKDDVREMDHSSASVEENESEDVVSFPCGPAGTTEVRQLRCGLTGVVGEDGRLAVGEIRERDANSGAILSRWDVYSVSKVVVDASEDPATIFLTFRTMRKDAQNRSYVMSADNCWALSEFLRPYWEEIEGEGSDLGAWECVKCSSQFAKEKTNQDLRYGPKVRCPICGSDMVVSLDQLPQPKSDTSLNKKAEEPRRGFVSNGDLTNKKLNRVKSPVRSVKIEAGSTRSGSADSNGSSRKSGERSSSSTPRLKSGVTHNPGFPSSSSQPTMNLNNPGSSDASSDIEVLSKASSSSIEVLAREDPEGQEDDGTSSCGVGNAAKKSVDSPVGSLRSGINMTSSTSSDSMTASYHTAYNVTQKSSLSIRDENFSTPNASMSRMSESLNTNASTQTLVGSMTPSSSATSTSNWPIKPPSSTSIVPHMKPGAVLSSSYTMLFPDNLKSFGDHRVKKDAIRPVIEALNRGNSVVGDEDDKVDACEEEGAGKDEGEHVEEDDKDFYSLSVLKAMAASLLAGRKRHRARDALYFLDERLASGDQSMEASMLTLHDDNEDELTELMMKYDYDKFQRFDHRLSLYCDIALFRSSSEELVGIARGEMLMAGFDLPQPALFVVSSKCLYFLQISGKESDDPDRWLTKTESKPLSQLKSVMKFVGDQGLLMDFGGQSKYPVIGFCTGDVKRTANLFTFLNDRLKNRKFDKDEKELIEFQMRQLEMSLFEFSQDETLDPCFAFFAVGYSKVSDGPWELKGVMMTASHVSVSSGDLHWMLSLPQFSSKAPAPGSQPVVQQLYPISDLTLVETHSKLPSAITLVFVDRSSRARNDSETDMIGLAEGKTVRDCLLLAFETPRTTRDFLGQLKSAWSSLFSGAELPVVSSSSFGG